MKTLFRINRIFALSIICSVFLGMGSLLTGCGGEDSVQSEEAGKVVAPEQPAVPPSQPSVMAAPAGLAPKTVDAPVMGSFIIVGVGNDNAMVQEWSFWQHQSDLHKEKGGIGGADDTFAWDINLNLSKVAPRATDLDRDLIFFPVASGRIVKWYADDDDPNNDVTPTPNNGNALLIEHTNNDGSKWFSSYLHAKELFVKVGDAVTLSTSLGKIGKSKARNNHLHLAIYSGENQKRRAESLLKSVDVLFTKSPLTIVSPAPPTINIREKTQLKSRAEGKREGKLFQFDLNGIAYQSNYFWTSSNPNVVKVDPFGNIAGVKAGSAEITVYFSGVSATIPVKVR